MTAPARTRTAENRHYALLGPYRIGELVRSLRPFPTDWVRVRTAYCGVCGSDVSKYAGLRAVGYPMSLGHEWVGVVMSVGRDVRTLVPGDVVTTDLNYRCGSCPECKRGRSHLCRNAQHERFSNRGFSTLVDIHADYLQPCRSGSAPHLALAEPLSCALHALAHVRPGPDESILVVGAGSLGLCTAFALCGTGHIAGFDVMERNPVRLARIGRSIEPLGRAVSEPAAPYDVVVDASGTVAGLRTACEVVSRGGRLCTLSHLPDDADAGFLLHLLSTKDVSVAISYLNGPATTLTEAIRLLERDWTARWDDLIEVRPLSDLPSVFAQRSTSTANKVIIDVAGSATPE